MYAILSKGQWNINKLVEEFPNYENNTDILIEAIELNGGFEVYGKNIVPVYRISTKVSAFAVTIIIILILISSISRVKLCSFLNMCVVKGKFVVNKIMSIKHKKNN